MFSILWKKEISGGTLFDVVDQCAIVIGCLNDTTIITISRKPISQVHHHLFRIACFNFQHVASSEPLCCMILWQSQKLLSFENLKQEHQVIYFTYLQQKQHSHTPYVTSSLSWCISTRVYCALSLNPRFGRHGLGGSMRKEKQMKIVVRLSLVCRRSGQSPPLLHLTWHPISCHIQWSHCI